MSADRDTQTIKFNKFDFSKLSVTAIGTSAFGKPLDDKQTGNKTKNKDVAAALLYNGKPFFSAKCDQQFLNIDNFGTIPFSDEYHLIDGEPNANARERWAYKFPDNKDNKEFFDWARELDEFMATDEVKDALFPSDEYSEKAKKKWSYVPLVKESVDKAGKAKKDKDGNPVPDYVKFKYDTDFKTGNMKTKFNKINTRKLEDGEENSKGFSVDFEPVRKESGGYDITSINVTCPTDLDEMKISYRSLVRPMIRSSRIWFKEGKDYGVAFKISRLDFAPRPYTAPKEQKDPKFSDDESEDELDQKEKVQQTMKTAKNVTKEVSDGEEDSDENQSEAEDSGDNDGSDEESDDENKKLKAVKATKNAKSSKSSKQPDTSESGDEDEDEPEVKPKKSKSKHK